MKRNRLVLATVAVAMVGVASWSLAWPVSAPAPADSADTHAAPEPVAEFGTAEARERSRVTTDLEIDPAAAMRVLVVDGATGRPEPDADVLFCPEPALGVGDVEHLLIPPSHDVEACARRSRPARTATDGIVVLPLRRLWGKVTVGARAGDRYGETSVDWHSTHARIELRDDRVLRVRVVDPEDRPVAGVALAIVLHWPDSAGTQRHGLGTSDPAGLVVLRHVQTRLSEWESTRQGMPRRCRIVADVPGLAHAGVAIDLARLPDEPVLVRLPGTGQLVVETRCGELSTAVWFRLIPAV